METQRIQSADNIYFDRIWEIYGYSFPLYEQRTYEHQLTAFQSDKYHMDAYLDDRGEVIGFLCYWFFDDYAYIEHYAMAKETRGQGYGSNILDEFLHRMHGKIVLLEIDPITDDISKRRLHFYQKLGFKMNPFEHRCPTYQPDAIEGDLLILTYPVPVDCAFYDKFYNDLHTVVMARSATK